MGELALAYSMITENSGHELFDFTQECLLGEAGESDELHLAGQVLLAFVKVIKGNRCYPPDHPLHASFLQELLQLMSLFLDRYHALVLQMNELEFSVHGRVMYQTDDLKSSVPFLFYRDGLRELRFLQGIEEWELKGLLEVINQSDRINQFEDDLVTLLWERDFVHVDFLAVDNFLEELDSGNWDTLEAFRTHLSQETPAHQIEFSLGKEEWDFCVPSMMQQLFDVPLLTSDQRLYQLTAEELKVLQDEIKVELSPTSGFHTIAVLLDMLPLISRVEVLGVAIDLLRKLLDELFSLDEYRRATVLLLHVNKLLQQYEERDWHSPPLRQLIESISATQWRDIIRYIVNAGFESQPEEADAILRQLPRQALPSVFQVLSELMDERKRSMLFTVLTEIGKADLEAVTRFARATSWQQARDVAYLLGCIGEKPVIPYLTVALSHRDPRVRKEAVTALARIPGSRSLRMITDALNDLDESVRCQAAFQLGQRGGEIAADALLQIVRARNFRQRQPDEMKSVLTAVGECGCHQAIDLLQQMVLQRALFGRARINTLRTYAAQALATLGTPEALAILEKGQQSFDTTIRTICAQAIRLGRKQGTDGSSGK